MSENTVNSNLEYTYTDLAPLSERQQEALETGLNPNQFVFAEEEPPPPEEDTRAAKTAKKKAKK